MHVVRQIVIGTLLLLVVQAASAFTVNFSWITPTEYMDGTPLSVYGISSFKLYSTPPGSTKRTLIAAITKTATTYRYVTNKPPLKAGSWCFYLSVLDVNKVESDRTDPVCINYTPPVI